MDELIDDIKKEGSTVDELEEEIEKEEESIDDILNDDEQEETTEDSSPKETEKDADSEQSEDKEEKTEKKTVPFHEHPRWKKMQDDNKSMREQLEANSGLSDKVEELQKNRTESETPLPKWWVSMYGDDEISKTSFKEHQIGAAEERALIKKEILEDQNAVVAQQDAETKKWNDWVDSEVETLKSEGHTFDKNALLKVATEWQPTDENGNVSLRKSLEILKMQTTSKEPDKTERKKVAAMTDSNNQGGDSTVKSLSSHEMRGQSMDTLIHGKD